MVGGPIDHGHLHPHPRHLAPAAPQPGSPSSSPNTTTPPSTLRPTQTAATASSPSPLPPGIYILRFNTALYYATQGIEGLYPYVEIAFIVTPGQTHYHIPLLLTANGYTTYRGS